MKPNPYKENIDQNRCRKLQTGKEFKSRGLQELPLIRHKMNETCDEARHSKVKL